MSKVLRPTFRHFTVQVTHDIQARAWVAECDALSLVTEAPSYEALVARVWAIAPEMAQENGLNLLPDHLHLVFQHEPATPLAQAL